MTSDRGCNRERTMIIDQKTQRKFISMPHGRKRTNREIQWRPGRYARGHTVYGGITTILAIRERDERTRQGGMHGRSRHTKKKTRSPSRGDEEEGKHTGTKTWINVPWIHLSSQANGLHQTIPLNAFSFFHICCFSLNCPYPPLCCGGGTPWYCPPPAYIPPICGWFGTG